MEMNTITKYKYYICEIKMYHTVLLRYDYLGDHAKQQYNTTVKKWFDDVVEDRTTVDMMIRRLTYLKTMLKCYIETGKLFL